MAYYTFKHHLFTFPCVDFHFHQRIFSRQMLIQCIHMSMFYDVRKSIHKRAYDLGVRLKQPRKYIHILPRVCTQKRLKDVMLELKIDR